MRSPRDGKSVLGVSREAGARHGAPGTLSLGLTPVLRPASGRGGAVGMGAARQLSCRLLFGACAAKGKDTQLLDKSD